MRVRLSVSGDRLRPEDFFPCSSIDHQLAPAVLKDRLDPLRRIVVLHHSKGGASLKDAQHRNKGTRVSREPDHDKIFRADPLFKEPAIHSARQLVHLLPREAVL